MVSLLPAKAVAARARTVRTLENCILTFGIRLLGVTCCGLEIRLVLVVVWRVLVED